MHNYVLKDINDETFISLCEFLQRKGKKRIVIDSWGGTTWYWTLMIEAINKAKDVVVAWTDMSSMAFRIFHAVNKPKMLVDGARGMAHVAAIEWLTVKHNKMMWVDQTAFIDSMCQMRQPDCSFMTEDELTRYNKWEDVYFTFNRLKEIFPDAEIIY